VRLSTGQSYAAKNNDGVNRAMRRRECRCAEINYFVDQPDAFGPSWFIGFNVAPVVENVMANWFK